MTNIPVVVGELVDTGYLNEVARAHYRKVTAKAVVNTLVETDLLNGEITVGAGAMSTTRALRVSLTGDWINNTGATVGLPRLKLKLGATTLLDTGAPGVFFGANAKRRAWKIDALIANLTAASQWTNLHLQGNCIVVTGGAADFAVGNGLTSAALTADTIDGHGGLASTVDTTVSQVLAVTCTLATANALHDMTLQSALVEIV